MENSIKKFDIKKLLVEKDLASIRKYVEQTPFNEIVLELEELNDLEVALFFRCLKTETSSELFSYLNEEQQQSIIQNLTKQEIADFINELYTDEIADVLEALPPDMAKTILLTVDKNTRFKVNQILQFDDEEVGSVMSVDIIALKSNMTNKEALELIKKKREESEIGQFYYVVDLKNKLQGCTTLEDIVFSPKEDLVSKKMTQVKSVKTKQLKAEAANIFSSEDYATLPVVDDNDILMGMLTSNDVIDIIKDEASEDIYKAAGINYENQPTTSYLKTSVLSIVKSRIFWLIILMIGSTLSQLIIQVFNEKFEESLKNVAESTGIAISSALIALIPVTSATSGNAGSQSTSTLTRASALGELKDAKMNKIILKEFSVGAVLGSILSLVNFVRLVIYYLAYEALLIHHYKFILIISLISSISLLISITLSKTFGAAILAITIKTKKDPAVMSAPLITTIIDALSTLIFFLLSYMILIPVYHIAI